MRTLRPAVTVVLVLVLVVGLLGTATVDLAGPHASAAAVEPTTYVANTGGNSITEYSAGADGNAVPVRHIGGLATETTGLNDPVAVALDDAGTLYVANSGGYTITEYAAGASGDDVVPIRTITGLTSPPSGIAVDGAHDVYVSTSPVVVQPPSPTPTSSPSPSYPSDIGVVPAGRFVGTSSSAPQPTPPPTPTAAPTPARGSSGTGSVIEYGPGATGNATPIRTITGLDHPVGIALGRAQNLYVLSSATSGPGSIVELAPGAKGDATPIRTITGPGNGLSDPTGVALDAAGDVYVVDYSGTGTISEFGPGAQESTPIRTITGVDRPVAIALDRGGNITVGHRTAGDGALDRVTEYPAGATLAKPIHTIIGAQTGLSNPSGVAIAPRPPIAPTPTPTTTSASSTGTSTSATASASSTATSTSASTSTSAPVPTPITGPILPLTSGPPPQAGPLIPSPPSTRSPRFQVSPSTAPPDRLVTARGLGYPPNAEITLVLSPRGDRASAGTTRPGARRPDEGGSRVTAEQVGRASTAALPVSEGTALELASPPFTADRAGDFVVSFRTPHLSPGGYAVQARSPCCQDQIAPLTLVAVSSPSDRSALTQLSQSLPSPRQVAAEIARDPTVLLHGLALATFMLLLVGFPAELFNRTLEDEDNYAEVRRWFRWGRRLRRVPRIPIPAGVARLGSRPGVQFAAFCVVAAALTALVDPDVLHYCQGGELVCAGDWWRKTLEVFIGFLVAIPVTTLVYGVPEEAVTRMASGQASRLRVLPLALLAAALFAAWSAVGQFLPGYVYGLVAGYAALRTRQPSERDEGLAVLFGGTAVLALSVLMWLTWGPVRDAAEGSEAGFAILSLNAVLSQLVVLGVQVVVFGLMPFTFLAGAKLKSWKAWVWGALYGTAALFYAVVLVISTRDTLGKARATNDEVVVIGLFLGFGALSMLFWGYFWLRARYRRRATPERAA